MSKENYIEEIRPHDSAYKHVSGYAEYTDDINEPKNTIYGAIGLSFALQRTSCADTRTRGVARRPIWFGVDSGAVTCAFTPLTSASVNITEDAATSASSLTYPVSRSNSSRQNDASSPEIGRASCRERV